MSEAVKTKNGGNTFKIIIIVLLLLIVVGGVAFGSFYIATRNSSKTNEAPKPKPVVVATFAVEELVVNLADEGSRRYIKTKIVVSYDSKNKKLAEELEVKKPILRDAMSYILRGKKAADFSQKGADDIKKEILNMINPLLEKGRLIDIYYNDILVQ